jgi:uncharacterized membrane protein YeiH
MDLQSYIVYWSSFITVGSFVVIDMIAATTNALNGALLSQRPDYYRGRQFTVVGILLLAIFGGIGGGVFRDVLLNKIPSALTNPWYLFLCLLAGAVGLLISYKSGQKFRESFYQFMTAFSLPWYAAIGVNAALSAGLPDIGAIFIGVIGPTAGRFLIDITAGHGVKQFIRGEWFVGTAVLTSIVYLVCAKYMGLGVWPATLVSFVVGFSFRVVALWIPWEEPLPKLPPEVVGEVARRESLKEKIAPDWEPKYD